MKRLLKWVGGVFVLLLLLGLAGIYVSSEKRLNRVYEIPDQAVFIPTDVESIELGEHIFRFRGCEACHSAGGSSYVSTGEEFGMQKHLNLPSQDIPLMEGNVYMDDPVVGKVVSSNLTTGKGGVGGEYTDEGWVKAIRHGVRMDGTPLLFMPSTEFYYLSDRDLGAVIAYIQTAPPMNNVLPPSSVSPIGRLVMMVPGITFIPAELIPHDAPRPDAPPVGITAEYGEYLTQSCKVCHGLTMSGGAIPGFPASWPPALNLTWGEGSALPLWTEDNFINTMRTGETPGDIQLRKDYMPWTSYRHMSDDELRAVWVYLQSLPPKAYGNH
ncbi:MAG: cytochrome c [Anaerolineales bacterium]|nr:cytochrome c [Anaerolineales bacterium]